MFLEFKAIFSFMHCFGKNFKFFLGLQAFAFSLF